MLRPVQRNSPEHIHAIMLIDTRFNQMLDDAKLSFSSRHPDYDPEIDPAFQAIRKKIEADRSEEWKYLRMEIDEDGQSGSFISTGILAD